MEHQVIEVEIFLAAWFICPFISPSILELKSLVKWGKQQMISGERHMINECAHGSIAHLRGKRIHGRQKRVQLLMFGRKLLTFECQVRWTKRITDGWRAHWLFWPATVDNLISLWFLNILRRSQRLVFAPVIHIKLLGDPMLNVLNPTFPEISYFGNLWIMFFPFS